MKRSTLPRSSNAPNLSPTTGTPGELPVVPLAVRARDALTALDAFVECQLAPLGDPVTALDVGAIAAWMDRRHAAAIAHLRDFLSSVQSCLGDPDWARTVADSVSVWMEIARAAASLAAAAHHAHRSGRESLARVAALLGRMPEPQRASAHRMLLESAIQTTDRLSMCVVDEARPVAERFRWLAQTARVSGYDPRTESGACSEVNGLPDIEILLADSDAGTWRGP